MKVAHYPAIWLGQGGIYFQSNELWASAEDARAWYRTDFVRLMTEAEPVYLEDKRKADVEQTQKRGAK